jgi:hypothetical protein
VKRAQAGSKLPTVAVESRSSKIKIRLAATGDEENTSCILSRHRRKPRVEDLPWRRPEHEKRVKNSSPTWCSNPRTNHITWPEQKMKYGCAGLNTKLETALTHCS